MTSHESELIYLKSARAVRERAHQMFERAARGELAHFELRIDALSEVTAKVAALTRATYPDVGAIPIHGRYRHFGVGGVDRIAALDQRLAGHDEDDRLVARADLVITSVLLDAGAGTSWSFVEPLTGQRFARSEGLAVASYDWFASGGLSSDQRDPLGVDADALRSLTPHALGAAFQVSPANPLVGAEGRLALLQRLAATISANAVHFGGGRRRPGNLALYLAKRAEGNTLRAADVLTAVLEALGPIWPGRESLDGVALGDVWTHSRFGRVPFHKLSQWLTYSLFEPLEARGIRITHEDELTGLPEYRNGGLFVDGGVLVPKHRGVLDDLHPVGSDVVIEWRALTVALIDRLAELLRAELGLSPRELPLAKVLEAGTWRAGRVYASEKRQDGSPPIRVDSDGTVF